MVNEMKNGVMNGMSKFTEAILTQINKHVSKGMTLVEALENMGAKKLTDTSLYYIPYGLYEDKVLFFQLPEKKVVKIGVSGGVAFPVEVPEGVVVEILDYDLNEE